MIDTILVSAPTITFLLLLAALCLAFAYEPPKRRPTCCQTWRSSRRVHGPDCNRKDQTT